MVVIPDPIESARRMYDVVKRVTALIDDRDMKRISDYEFAEDVTYIWQYNGLLTRDD